MFEELTIRRILKKELTSETYVGLPYKFQKEPRIIAHLIKNNPSLISIVPSRIDISSYIMANYDLISYLSAEQLNDCIEKIDISKINMTQELFEKLDTRNQLQIFKAQPITCIECFDNQKKVATVIEIIFAKCNKGLFKDTYKDFPEEKLNNIILNFDEEEFQRLLNNSLTVVNYVINLLLSLSDELLDTKIHLLKSIYDKLPANLKNKFDLKEAGDNIEKIVKLSDELQVIYFLQNIDKLVYAKPQIIEKCLMQFNGLSADILLKCDMTHRDKLVYLLKEQEQEKVFSRNFHTLYYNTSFSSSKINLDNVIYKKLSQITDANKRNKLLALYVTLEEKPIVDNDYYRYHNQKYQITRLLYDNNIVNNNSAELLTQYKQTYDKTILIKILENAYGPHVLEIFKERPGLDLLNIDNFKIFDKKIYDKLGKNFIHHILNCELFYLDDFIGKLAEDENTLNQFANYFKCITNNLPNLDLNTITNAMEKFIMHEELIKQINFNNIDETTKRNLNLLINDDNMLSIGINTINELNNYPEIRNQRFIEIGSVTKEPKDMKNLILAYVFGKTISKDDVLEKLSFDKALSVFNIANIIQNEAIIQKIGLNKDEVSMLLLLHEIQRIQNINVLKDVYTSLINRNLGSILFENTFNKIKNYYTEDIKAGLLSTQTLEAMPRHNLAGVDVVPFNGNEFTLICSTTELNMSEEYNMNPAKVGAELLNDWVTREEGVNTISTALVSSDTSIYPANNNMWREISENIIFVFGNESDIIGVGAADISSEHNKRSKTHTFGFIGAADRDTAFSTMSELKERINRNKRNQLQDDKFDSEITITRKEEDIRKTGGGFKRTMPIAMYVVGEITPKHLETAKIFNSYYEQNGLGKFRIIQVDPRHYKGEGIIVDSEYKEREGENNGRNIR